MARTADRNERRQQIMDAFSRCLKHKSYFQTTIRDIAEEAGLASSLVYYYFENKEDLLLALFESAMEHFQRTLTSFFEPLSSEAMGSEAFENAFQNFLIQYYGGEGWDACATFNALWALAQYDEKLKEAMCASYRRFEAVLQQLVAAHVSPEACPEKLARLMLIFSDGIVILSTLYQLDLDERIALAQYGLRICMESNFLKK